jgi:hypothetical protein
METCGVIWNEFNENEIFKKIINHLNQCLFNIIKTQFFERFFFNDIF